MNCEYSFSPPAVSPHSILKRVSAAQHAVKPEVMFGSVSTDSSSNFYDYRRKSGRRVQFCGAFKQETDVSEVWQGVLKTLGDPSEGHNFRAVTEKDIQRDVLTVGETWPRYANQPTGPGRTGPVEGIPLAGSDPYEDHMEQGPDDNDGDAGDDDEELLCEPCNDPHRAVAKTRGRPGEPTQREREREKSIIFHICRTGRGVRYALPLGGMPNLMD